MTRVIRRGSTLPLLKEAIKAANVGDIGNSLACGPPPGHLWQSGGGRDGGAAVRAGSP